MSSVGYGTNYGNAIGGGRYSKSVLFTFELFQAKSYHSYVKLAWIVNVDYREKHSALLHFNFGQISLHA